MSSSRRRTMIEFPWVWLGRGEHHRFFIPLQNKNPPQAYLLNLLDVGGQVLLKLCGFLLELGCSRIRALALLLALFKKALLRGGEAGWIETATQRSRTTIPKAPETPTCCASWEALLCSCSDSCATLMLASCSACMTSDCARAKTTTTHTHTQKKSGHEVVDGGDHPCRSLPLTFSAASLLRSARSVSSWLFRSDTLPRAVDSLICISWAVPCQTKKKARPQRRLKSSSLPTLPTLQPRGYTWPL